MSNDRIPISLLYNYILISRGPSSVQAKGFRATIMMIQTIIVELHRIMKEEEEEEEEERRRRQNLRYRRLAVCLVARFSSNFEKIFASRITR